jgi:ureidoacrylate peracid hydrolase
MLSTQEVLCNRKSALIIIDVQNDFCHPKGSLSAKGLDIGRAVPMLEKIHKLIDAAHAGGRPVIFIQNVEDEFTDGEAWCSRPDGDENSPNEAVTRRDSWGAQFFGVEPEKGDIVVQKHRFNAFYNTSLETVLKSLKIETLVFTGVATNVCVLTSATQAVVSGYHVVLAEDACTAWFQDAHDFAVNNIRLFVGKVCSSAEICDYWKA